VSPVSSDVKKLNNRPNGSRIAPIAPSVWIQPTRLGQAFGECTVLPL
jgi:hypothetical protein